MMQIRRSKRIEATIHSRRAPVSTLSRAKSRIEINQTSATTAEDPSEPIDDDPMAINNEKTVKSEHVLSGCLGFGDNVFRYQCSVCNNRTASLRSLLHHRQSAHHITQKPIKNVDLEPDTDDPNYYCKSCEKQSNGPRNYRVHLHRIHHLDYKSLQQKRQPDNTILDPIEVDYHCTLCELTCQDEQAYQEHLKKHQKTKPSAVNTSDLPDWNDPSLHCALCNYTYASRNSYTRHCKYTHKMGVSKNPAHSGPYCKVCKRGFVTTESLKGHNNYIHARRRPYIKSSVNPGVIPDAEDPNNHCRSCQRSYSSKRSYRRHLIHIHQIDWRAPAQQVKPDANDPSNYCRSCNKTLSSRSLFVNHMFLKHSMRQSNTNKGTLQPYNNDPNLYCRYCDKTLVCKEGFKNHLFLIHSIRQPNKTTEGLQPDVNDPNNYCRVCKRHYPILSKFRRHLRTSHQMILPPVEKRKNRKPSPSDTNDPDFHGSISEEITTRRPAYRRRCKDTHRAALVDRKDFSPPAATDISSSPHYCTQCVRSFRNKYVFTSHMKAAHGILA